MIKEETVEKYLKQGEHLLYYPATANITFDRYVKNWLEPFMEICAKSGISTFEAMLILEAHKRNLARVSKVESPAGVK